MSVRDDGRTYDETLARELGRLSESRPRFGSGPKDSLLTPEVLSLGTWLGLEDVEDRKLVGVVSSPATLPARDEEAVDPRVRFRERIVTVDGTVGAPAVRGEARGGVCVGAGSLDRTECTLASSRCICAVRVRMCDRELDAGILWLAMRGFVDLFAGVRSGTPLETRPPGARLLVVVAGLARGFGVTLLSRDGRRDLRATPGVLAADALGKGADASDMGGDGGSRSSAALCDFASGGVVTSGELAVELGDASTFLSKVGDSRTERSVEIVDMCRDSCFLSLSCRSSASILRSDSSSRSRWVPMRRFSRSCSPSLISSSIMTARSMAWLCLDSMSSSDEVVFRACRS